MIKKFHLRSTLKEMTKERYLPAKGVREINVMGIKKSIWCESETYINFWQMTIKWLEDKNHTLKQQKKKSIEAMMDSRRKMD